MTQSLLLGLVLTCNYSIFNAPFATIRFTFDDANKATNKATVIQYGKQDELYLEQNPVVGDEMWNLTLAPKDPQNELFVKIFYSSEKGYTSILSNPKSPIGKEMHGVCSTN